MRRGQMKEWSTGDMGRLDGRRAIVTGVGGLGFEIGLALAGTGASVLFAGRDA
jgi:NAD(P)-dependent dehydrogenase (short-subunit alcohol dehydrogenase family)